MVIDRNQTETDVYAQLLKELNMFFCKKNSGEFGFNNEMLNEILLGANCDLNKLFSAVTQINKNNSMKYRDTNNVFDVSKQSNEQNKIFVKGFSPDENNILYFFNGNQKNPYFKVKSVLSDEQFLLKTELADGGVSFSSHGKKQVNRQEPFVYMTNDFLQRDGKTVSRKNAKLHSHSNPQNVKDQTLYDEDFLRFYSMFVDLPAQNRKDNLTSVESNQIIKNCIFDQIKNISNFEYEIDFGELLKIADYVIYGNETEFNPEERKVNLNNISNFICNDSQSDDSKNGTVFGISLGQNKNGFVKTKIYPSFCSIDILGENKEILCNYIICTTLDGSMIYRSVKDKNFSANKNNITNYTLNCSNNKIKFSGSHNDRENSKYEVFPLEMVLEVNGDGSVNFDSKSISQMDDAMLKNTSTRGEMS